MERASGPENRAKRGEKGHEGRGHRRFRLTRPAKNINDFDADEGHGRRLVEEVDRMGEELGTEARRGISREERAQLVSVLQRLRENLRRMDLSRGTR